MTVDMVSLENRVLEAGQSSELAQCFRVIQETTIDDADKYPEKTCRELARVIVCRTYASAVHELCHLVAAAASCDPTGRYESLFWDTGPARARNFRAYFIATETPDIDVADNQLTINYPDAAFSVSYGRMPFLSALAEFLMTALGYRALDDILTPLIDDPPNAERVSAAANELSRKVYGYLQDHLPAVQDQRKHRSFLQFIAERAAGRDAGQAITDEAVLDYWCQHADDGSGDGNAGPDSRTYRSVFKTATRLLHLLRRAADKHGLAVALPIGTDREAGEVDPAGLEAAMVELDDETEPLAGLEARAADGVKFLNKREVETLRQALHGDAAGRLLTRSVLRNAVFGDAQARLIQALRQGLGAGELAARIDAEPEDGYAERLAGFAALAGHLERMLLICFHVLYRQGERAAVDAALRLRPEMDLGTLATAPDGGNIVSLQAEQALRRFFDAGADGPVAALAADAARAAKGFARQGFSQAAWNDPDVVAVFAECVSELDRVRTELAGFLDRHAAAIDWAELLDADTPRFRDRFTRLYGGRHG